jgi:hypothetical protein
VSEALGGERLREVRNLTTKQACRYGPRSRRSFTELTAIVTESDEEEYTYGEEVVDTVYELLLLNYPDSIETEVAGMPALQRPTQRLIRDARGWTAGTLYVAPEPHRFLSLSAYAPRGVNVDEALVGIAELAVPRIFAAAAADGSVAPEASGSPEPSTSPASASASPEPGTSDTPFAAGIGGDPVSVVEEWNGRDWLAALSPPADLRRRLVQALEEQDRSLGDLALRTIESSSGLASVLEFSVEGADMGRLFRPLLQAMPLGRDYEPADPALVAGKDVRTVDDGGNVLYAYPQGDHLWLVSADEEDLPGIFEQLP